MNHNHFFEIESQISHITLKQFRLIFKAIQQHSKLAESQCGVTSSQLWAIWEIFKTPGMKITDLAKAMSIHHSTTNTLVNKLSKKGLVSKEKCLKDNRVVKLILTENGQTLIHNNTLEPRGKLQQALFEMSENDLKQLSLQLNTLIRLMKVDVDTSEPV
ncbi:MAG: hypothetical protein RL755_1751 [Pseudomonadota bacterium]|jgi:DNA-binding MarR family transcriptional regulator